MHPATVARGAYFPYPLCDSDRRTLLRSAAPLGEATFAAREPRWMAVRSGRALDCEKEKPVKTTPPAVFGAGFCPKTVNSAVGFCPKTVKGSQPAAPPQLQLADPRRSARDSAGQQRHVRAGQRSRRLL